ncbi:hypothetical protein [Niabella aurantiaca]|uniref:glycine-rich domain-containing protein n=1 Tax=Niabella aurantiaca TaxID=379900 RepID=UPI0003A73CAA|nr:hypothetical protein [Niabella aurantiaca]
MKSLFCNRMNIRFVLVGALLVLLSTVSAQTTIFSTPGGHSYTVPSGQSQLAIIKVWGAGAGGRTRSSGGNNAGGGGGGGAYSQVTVTLEEGTYDVYVGNGGGANTGGDDSYFEIVPILYAIRANGGNASSFLDQTQGGSGGNAAPTAGWIFWGATSIVTNGGGNGADGDNGNGGYGGGGGGAAGVGGDGGNGLNQTQGSGNGGGNGGDGANSTINAGPGIAPGGGGGGGFRTNSGNSRSGGIGGDGRVEITILQVLPVQFGPITATTGGDDLLVSFTTEDEANNDHFNIQASEDGKDFQTIATIKSKHAGAAFTGTTTYSVRIDKNGNTVLLGLSVLAAAALGFGGARRNRKMFMAAVLGYVLIGFGAVSCSKNSAEIITDESDRKGYIRIEQVDTNGHSNYSKIVAVVRNQ